MLQKNEIIKPGDEVYIGTWVTTENAGLKVEDSSAELQYRRPIKASKQINWRRKAKTYEDIIREAAGFHQGISGHNCVCTMCRILYEADFWRKEGK
jgi:hypothetical protein